MRAEDRAMLAGHVDDFMIGRTLYTPPMLARLERVCSRLRAYAGDPHDAGRLVVEALEARLDVLEAVGR